MNSILKALLHILTIYIVTRMETEIPKIVYDLMYKHSHTLFLNKSEL